MLVVNSLYEIRLQGIMVVVLMKTPCWRILVAGIGHCVVLIDKEIHQTCLRIN